MIVIDGIEYRNLQEQVLKNKEDIKYILEEEGVLNEFGIKVVGQVTNMSDLPDPTTYEGEYGDAFAVGTEAPYSLYIFTRAFSGKPSPFWFDIGLFPAPSTVPGPTGPTGATGPAGTRGSTWTTGESTPTSTSALVNDMYLKANGEVYQYNGSSWVLSTSIKGPQGIQGIQGIQGVQGPVGPQGIQGIQGPAGKSFQVVGIVANTGQLPDPTTIPDNEAYLVGNAGDYNMYAQVNEQWVDTGKVETAIGPQGPQGPQGEPGTGATVAVGTVTTLPAGSQATVTNVGSPNAAVFNFGIPKGDQGDPPTGVYQHRITFRNSGLGGVTLTILNNSETKLETVETIYAALEALKDSSLSTTPRNLVLFQATGYLAEISSYSTGRFVIGIRTFATSQNALQFVYIKINNQNLTSENQFTRDSSRTINSSTLTTYFTNIEDQVYKLV